MVNLRHWKIITNDICEHCQIEPEDVVHALWSCLLLSTMWNQDSEWSFRSTLHVVSFREVLEHIIEVGVDLDLFATIIKTVWSCRNTIRTSFDCSLSSRLRKKLGLLEWPISEPPLQNHQIGPPVTVETSDGNYHLGRTSKLTSMALSFEMENKQGWEPLSEIGMARWLLPLQKYSHYLSRSQQWKS